MVGAAFIAERLAASVQLLNKTSQSLLHTMYSQNQTGAAQATKSFTPYDHILHFFLENPLLFVHTYAKQPERIYFFLRCYYVSTD